MTESEDVAAQAEPLIVTLPAEIDKGNAATTAAELTTATTAGPRRIIADLTGTTFVDSSGARTLYHAYRDATTFGAQLRFVITHPHVLRVLDLMGLDQELPIYPSVDQACTT